MVKEDRFGGPSEVVWDSGLVAGNATSITYGGQPLQDDTQYTWSVAWAAVAAGGLSAPASAGFATGIFDWSLVPSQWRSIPNDQSANRLRLEYVAVAACLHARSHVVWWLP